jgi:hypothetical protein
VIPVPAVCPEFETVKFTPEHAALVADEDVPAVGVPEQAVETTKFN